MTSGQEQGNFIARWLQGRPNLTVFITNFCIMTLELVAGRLIAPYVGVSLYTWTAVIGIVLAGMSVGNYWGGKWADRWASPRIVGRALLAAGVLTFASLLVLTLIGESLAVLKIGYLLAVITLTGVFFLPSMMLGMVSPMIAKLTVRDLNTSGETVGKIYAAAALGSIVGTYATGFWLIATLGVRTIVLIVAVMLCVMAVGYLDLESAKFFSARRRVVLALAGLLLAGGAAALAWQPLCQRESNYYCIRITADAAGKTKILTLDHLVHSFTDMRNPRHLIYTYEQLFAAFYDYSFPAEPRVLFLGGGAYTLPRYLVHRYGAPRGVVTEIDPAVSETALAEFDMPRDSSLATVNIDARMFVRKLAPEDRYDLIIGDVFSDFSIPYHLTTREFTRLIADHLTPDGWYAANVIDALEPGRLVMSYLLTLSQVFEHVYLFQPSPPPAADLRTTLVVAASRQPLDEERLRRAAARLGFDGAVTALVPAESVATRLEGGDGPVILTDDFAPVDNLLAPLFVVSE